MPRLAGRRDARNVAVAIVGVRIRLDGVPQSPILSTNSQDKAWLERELFPRDKLIVERGNVEARDPLFFTKNRFVVSAKREIRGFVEDDPNKARRLADVCEIVFLIDQPYNRDAADIPRNVVRVKGWTEICQYLRERL